MSTNPNYKDLQTDKWKMKKNSCLVLPHARREAVGSLTPPPSTYPWADPAGREKREREGGGEREGGRLTLEEQGGQGSSIEVFTGGRRRVSAWSSKLSDAGFARSLAEESLLGQ